MAKREKKPVLTPITAAEAEEVMSVYAETDAQIEQIQAKMDEQITAIRDKYAQDIQSKQLIRDEAMQRLQMYAETNKEKFEKKRSVEMAHGSIGFRTGTPKVNKRKGLTWEAVAQLAKEFLPTFIRTKEELNKEMVIEHKSDKQFEAGYEKCGLEVVQEETFFISLKKEENATVK